MSRETLGRILLTVSLLSLGWAVVLLLTGGFRVSLLFVRISSSDPTRPLILGLVCAAAVWFLTPHLGIAFVRYADPIVERSGPTLAIVAAAVVVFTGIKYGTFSAGGSDSYGYVSQADLWLAGGTSIDQRWLPVDPPFDDWVFSPLGYRPGRVPHTIVPTYSPGLPILMAAFKAVAGASGPFLVVPVLGGLTVLMTWLLGRLLFDGSTGLGASLLMAASPVFLFQLFCPMSDVPVTAGWTLALLFALVKRPFAAGLAATLAIAIRPNLAPLAIGVAIVACVDDGRFGVRSTVRRAAWFAIGTLPGVIGIALLNRRLYGSPVRSGYGGVGDLYHLANVGPNLARYPAWLIETQTPFILAAIVPLVWRRFTVPEAQGSRWPVRAGLACFVALLVVPYLFYEAFASWTFLRFLLPAFPILVVLAVGFVRATRPLIGQLAQMTLLALVVIVVFDLELTTAERRGIFEAWKAEGRYATVANDLARVTPPNSIYLAMQHSGSVRYYTHRMTARFDSLPRGSLDAAIERLRAGGFRPYILLDEWEMPDFSARFEDASASGRLDWKPMMTWRTLMPVALYDPLARPGSRPASTPSQPSGGR